MVPLPTTPPCCSLFRVQSYFLAYTRQTATKIALTARARGLCFVHSDSLPRASCSVVAQKRFRTRS